MPGVDGEARAEQMFPVDRHRRQLDSLRTFAVFAVILGHFAPRVLARLPLGDLGVRLFFVLSGFLITGILLDCRALVADGATPLSVIGRFYVRRGIRIVPAFYGVLAAMWVAGMPEVRDSLPWHLAYASNVYFARLGTWHEATSHFWSLAVEEQFYVVWPMVVLFQPARRMSVLLILVAASAPLYRMVCLWNGWSPITMQVLPFGSVDSLAVGALLAWLAKADERGHHALTLVGRLLVPVALGLTALGALHIRLGGTLRTVFLDTIWSVAFVWLIDRAAVGFRGAVGRLLDSVLLVYLGRISYGLYLFHLLSPSIVRWLWVECLGRQRLSPGVGVGAAIVLTILLAASSWRFYEGPLNRLKRYVPYDARRGPSIENPLVSN